MSRIFSYLNGPQTYGRSRKFWLFMVLIVVAFLFYPNYVSSFKLLNTSYYFLYIPMALGLCLLWGYGGTLSFAQVAFFGTGGYAYGVIAGNLSGSYFGGIIGVLGAMLVAAIFSLIFGYFVFYGRVDEWVIPILTLVLNLALSTFMNQTAGSGWNIGEVALGGYNGMVGIPPLSLGDYTFYGKNFYFLVIAIVIILFLALRILVNSKLGNIIVGIKEDAIRTEFLGHDVRFLRLIVFMIAAVLASLSGILYVAWGNFISPESMGILNSTLPIIWVVVGGGGSLLGVTIATVVLSYLDYNFAAQGSEYAFVLMGVILVSIMMIKNMDLSPTKLMKKMKLKN